MAITYEEIKERVTNMIGEPLTNIRKDALERGYEIQIVKDNGIYSSDRWHGEDSKVIKIATENAVLKEIIESGPLSSDKYNGDPAPEA